jgi:hypothetical protein
VTKLTIDLKFDETLVAIWKQVLGMDWPASHPSSLSKNGIAISFVMVRLFELDLMSKSVELFALFIEDDLVLLL